MAPKSGEIPLVDGKDSLPNDSSSTNETEEIWSSILRGVASSKIVPTKNLLVLGDKESGKSTLIRHLKGEEDEETFEAPNANGTMSKSIGTGTDDLNKRSNNDLALSYTFVEVKDDEAEDTLARLGIYQIAGPHESYQSLLRFALNSSTLPDSLVVIVLDWARPWTFVETLQRWIKFIELGIEGIKAEGNTGNKDGWTKGKAIVDELKELIERFIQNYSEPDSANQNTVTNSESDDVALPLGPGVLTTNLAVPLVVVCAKSDNVSNLEREKDYKEEQFDYIQQSLRTICLKYGAALFYTSTHQPKTFTDLRRYILHRLLGSKSSSGDIKSPYAFNIKANVVERDTVFVPTGWDSWGKIKVLRDGFRCEETLQGWDLDMGDKPSAATSEERTDSIRKLYEETCVHEDLDEPLSVQPPIEAEDEQQFFSRHFEILQKANGERPPPPSVVGPMGAPSYSYGDIGVEIPDLDSTPISSTATPRPKSANTSPPVKVQSQSSGINTSNGNATAPPTNESAVSQPNQNEVLANFFQNLLSKRNAVPTNNPSGAPKPSSSEVKDRKMVEQELEKMRVPPTSMAGK